MPAVRPSLTLALALCGLAAVPAAAAVPPEGAAQVFDQARAICDRDGGRFWGKSLCGPILIVDPNDRAVIANQADPGGVLKPSGGFFVGVLPESEFIANTPLEWSGTRWTELMWPLPEEAAHRHVMLAHELFHRIQPSVGMIRPDGGNQHLDTLEGRYLLQLEWRALARALQAPHAAARRAAVADVLLFRQQRYRLFPQAAAEENALEINEGVPEYTGVILGLETPQARTAYALKDLSAFLDAPTFVRSFAYATDAAYGLLLDQAAPGWRARLADQRLDQLLASAFRLPPADPAALKTRAATYDDGTLRAAELKREEGRQARLAALRAKLVDGPVLVLLMRKISYQFRPQTLVPLGEDGTVYPTIRISSEWGVLEVDGDALLAKDMSAARVSAAGVAASRLQGQGWKLTLKPGWAVVPGARAGDLLVRQADAAAR